MSVALQSLRAPGHRDFVSPLFGGPPIAGEDPKGLTYMQVLTNPKLVALGGQVYGQLQAQFSENRAHPEESLVQAQYRRRLEGWAQMLEIMLDEVLNELDGITPSQPPARSEVV